VAGELYWGMQNWKRCAGPSTGKVQVWLNDAGVEAEMHVPEVKRSTSNGLKVGMGLQWYTSGEYYGGDRG